MSRQDPVVYDLYFHDPCAIQRINHTIVVLTHRSHSPELMNRSGSSAEVTNLTILSG